MRQDTVRLETMPTMIGLPRFAFLAAVCCGLLPLEGCSRTSDGTVVMPKTPQMSFSMPARLTPAWARRAPREAEPYPVAAAQFPPPPEAETASPRTRSTSGRRPVREAALACANQTDSRGRTRVVCK
jgi:hypothetical protein